MKMKVASLATQARTRSGWAIGVGNLLASGRVLRNHAGILQPAVAGAALVHRHGLLGRCDCGDRLLLHNNSRGLCGTHNNLQLSALHVQKLVSAHLLWALGGSHYWRIGHCDSL